MRGRHGQRAEAAARSDPPRLRVSPSVVQEVIQAQPIGIRIVEREQVDALDHEQGQRPARPSKRRARDLVNDDDDADRRADTGFQSMPPPGRLRDEESGLRGRQRVRASARLAP